MGEFGRKEATYRPSGVVILILLQMISGVFALIATGVILTSLDIFGGLFGGNILVLAGWYTWIIFIFLALLEFIIAYGLLAAREWAASWGLIFSIIGAMIGLLMLPGGIIMLVISILSVYFLTRPRIEEFFGVKGEWKARLQDIKYTLYLIRRNPLVMAGLIISLFFVVLALSADVIVNPNLATTEGYPNSQFPFERKYMWSAGHFIQWGPGIAIYQGPEFFWLGTDSYGRDILKMIILAIPLDLYNAAVITIGATIFGTFLGAIAGYVGGAFDEAILRITDVFFAFPGLVLALVFAAMFGRTIETLRLAILLVWWPPYVRLMRGQVLIEKEKPYVEALRAVGASHFGILFNHITLNAIYPILVQATMDFGGVVLTFSALMFLGFAPSAALPELGNLAADGYGHVFDAPWVILFPGLVMLTLSLAFNLVGDGLRDVLDPRLRR